MELKAIHAIYRTEKKKQIRVEPGALFECPDDEGKEYLATKAASAVVAEKKPAAKKPATKKDAAPAQTEDGEDGEGLLG